MVGTTKLILGKKETVYATDATPSRTQNAIVTRNFKVTPLKMDVLERKLDLPTRGGSKVALTNAQSTRSFEVEIAGSGAAGTAPPWMELLEACGMSAPVLTASTSAVQKFAPAATDLSSMTFYDWHDNQQRIGIGSRGTYGWDFTAGAYPFFSFDFLSLVPTGPSPVKVSTYYTPWLDRWKDPVEVNQDNTSASLDGYVLNLKSFTGQIGASPKLRALTNQRAVTRGNHAATCKIVADAPDIAAKDYFKTLKAGSMVAWQLIHGTSAGAIIQNDTANMQITAIELIEDDDVLQLSIDARMNVVTGSDDLTWTAK